MTQGSWTELALMSAFSLQAFEDLEFHQMEEAAHKETERDELLKEIHELDKQVDGHEKQLTEMDKQQKELLKNVRTETEHLEQQRKQLTSTLNKVPNNGILLPKMF